MPAALAIYYVILIIIGVLSLICLWNIGAFGMMGLPTSLSTYIGMIIAVSTLICLWRIFKKEGRPGWAAIVPVYNCVVLCQIGGYSGRTVWLFLIPIVNVVIIYRVWVGVSKAFGQSERFGLGLFLLSPIFLPILVFSKRIQREYADTISAPDKVDLPATRKYIERKAAQECFVRAGELETGGEREKAIAQYTKTISIDSRHTAAYFKRGTLLMESGTKADAIADFRRVIELGDDPALSDSARENLAKLE